MTLTPHQILTRLQGNDPLSLVRIGDGEGIVLNCTKDLTAYNLCNNAVLKRQMGYYPPMDQVYEIRQNLIDTYKTCDIIGIPAHAQKTNEHWTSVVNILNENVPKHTTQLCSVDIAYDFLNLGYFNTMLQNRRVLNYISCRDLDKQFHETWNIGRVNQFLVAPEAKFSSGYDGDIHYPTQFNRIPRWMDVVGAEGNLLFVGAGVIGKIYCNWWRDRGGIAFDIGSIFDEWANKITRGPERGLNAEGTKYKL